MTSQLIVRLDADKKRKIAEKAKAAGVSMQVVFSYLADAWLDDKVKFGMYTCSELVESPKDYEARAQWRKDLANGDAVDGKEFLSSLLAD